MTLFVSTIFSDPSTQGHLLYDGNNGILPTLFPTGLCSSLMKGMTVILKHAQNGKISPKTHKNTPEVSQFYSFY